MTSAARVACQQPGCPPKIARPSWATPITMPALSGASSEGLRFAESPLRNGMLDLLRHGLLGRSSATAVSRSLRLNGLASARAAPRAITSSALMPNPDSKRPEIAMTGMLG